jgi:hypothetical protein
LCYIAARIPLLKPTDRLKRIKFCNAILKMNNYELQGGGGSVGIWGCITYDGPAQHMLNDGRMDQHRYIDRSIYSPFGK